MGALPVEVVAMNALTVNLHLLLVSFYRPQGSRTKLMIEAGAFPSDRYAALVPTAGCTGSILLNTSSNCPRVQANTSCARRTSTARIAQEGDQLACVMLCGVQYYTGQWMPMREITQAAHAAGRHLRIRPGPRRGQCPPGRCHDWDVDFACWCGYKYLNGGPGCTAGAFVHERHANKPELHRLEGWWGHAEARRFKMEPDFDLMPGAEGWQTSNAPVMNMAAMLASLAEFRAAGMERLRAKSLDLTAFLESGIHAVAALHREPARNPHTLGPGGSGLPAVAGRPRPWQGPVRPPHQPRCHLGLARTRRHPHGPRSPLQFLFRCR